MVRPDYNSSLSKMQTMKNRQILRVSFRAVSRFSSIPAETDRHREVAIIENIQQLLSPGQIVQPHFMLLCLCREGSAVLELNGMRHQLGQDDLLLVFGDSVVEIVSWTADFRVVALIQDRDFVQETLMSMLQLWPYLLQLMRQPVIHLNSSVLERVLLNYQLLELRLRQPQHTFRREALEASLQAAYFDVCDLLKREGGEMMPVNVRSFSVFDQFVRLLSKAYVRHREIAWYAAELNMNPKHLSNSVKMVSGRTASNWIIMFVVAEIKSLLRNTDMSIKEIAEELHFPDQSAFGKYFRKNAGMSPSEFRLI